LGTAWTAGTNAEGLGSDGAGAPEVVRSTEREPRHPTPSQRRPQKRLSAEPSSLCRSGYAKAKLIVTKGWERRVRDVGARAVGKYNKNYSCGAGVARRSMRATTS
ncbi:MAG: hypothetical protein AAB375_02335, partial [Patescibacteria group bacterium]